MERKEKCTDALVPSKEKYPNLYRMSKGLHLRICPKVKQGLPCPKYPDVIKK